MWLEIVIGISKNSIFKIYNVEISLDISYYDLRKQIENTGIRLIFTKYF